MSPRVAAPLRVIAIAVVGALVWWFVRRIDWHVLGRALHRAEAWPLVVSSLLYFACLFGKTVCWRIALWPHDVGVWRLYRYTIVAFAASALLPARTGELWRMWALKNRDGIPVHDSAAVAFAEKLLDALTLVVIAAPLPWLLPLPLWIERALIAAAAVALLLFVTCYIAVGRISTPRSWLARFVAGLRVVRSPRRIALSVGTLLAVWAADLFAVMLVLHAVGLDIPIAGGVLILFSFNLAIAVPSTPAQVGALQVGALVATDLLGIPREPALAFALLYQAMQILPLIVVGLVLDLDLVLGRVVHSKT